MAINPNTGADEARQRYPQSGTGSFTAAAQVSPAPYFMPEEAPFNIYANGGVGGYMQIQASIDGGTTWSAITMPDGTANNFAVTSDGLMIAAPNVFERGMLYRLRCTALTSGTITYRLSR